MKLLAYGAFTAFLLNLLSCLVGAHSLEEGVELKEIVDAFREQQATARSVRIVVDARQVVSKTNTPKTQQELTARLLEVNRPQELQGKDDRQPDIKDALESTYRVTIMIMGNDGACRITSDRSVFNPNEGRLLKAVYDVTYDGRDHSRLLWIREGSPIPHGVIYGAGAKNQDVNVVGYKPIFMALRGLDTDYVERPTVASYTSIDTAEGLVHLKSGKREMWLDKVRGFALRRYKASLNSGRPFREVNVARIEQRESVWIPIEWKCTYFGPNSAPESLYEYSVAEVNLNPDFTEEDFRLEFPANAEITKAPGSLPELQLAPKPPQL